MTTNFFKPNLLVSMVAFTVLAVIAVWNSNAKAQVVASEWNGPGDYAYDIQSMPDLDQRRSTLDNNGSMHCVPTATMNLLAYAANFPGNDMPPYPGVWMGAPGHGEMTGWINWLGLYMGTSGEDGTTGTGMVNGLKDWIEDSGSPIVFSNKFRKNDYWPTIDDAAFYATNGAIVQFAFGRYEWRNGTQGLPELTSRSSGHAVTLKLAFADNGNERGNRLIHYRDPGTDENNLVSNSNFSSVWPATAKNMNLGYDPEADGLADFFTMTSLINPPPDDNLYRILDSFTAVFPPCGTTVGGNSVSGIFKGGKLGFSQDQLPVPYSPPTGQTVIAVAPHPDQHSSLVLKGIVGRRAELVQVAHNGQTIPLTNVSSQTTCFTPGFGQDVYLAAGREVSVIRLTNNGGVRPVRVGFAPAPIQAMSYHEDTDSLLVVYGRNAGIFRRNPASWINLGTCIGVGEEQNPFRTIAIAHGRVYAALQNGRVASAQYPVRNFSGPLSFSNMALSGVTNAQHVDSDGASRLYVSDSIRGLLEFELVREGWRPANKAWFAGVGPNQRFIPFRSRMNIRPGDLDDSEWKNIDPRDLVPLGPNIPD